jgi:hypothetical protein
MKKYLLALALFALSFAGADTAWATCTGPAVMKDNAAATFNMTLQQDGTGNCNSAVALAAGGSTTMQSAAVANGNGTILTVGGFNVALVNINCSVACSGGTTINFEGTDSTSTFFPVQAFPVGGGTPVSTAITSGQFYVSLTGLASIRARISAYSAGTITVTGTPSYGANAQQIAAAGGATSANQGTTADAPCTLPATTTACSEIAIQKATANAANSPASLAVNVTPTDCSATVVTGGTAVNAFTAQATLHGFTILNDDTSEVMWISFTTTAAASTAGSYPLAPATATSFAGASSFTSPPGFGTNHALSVVAATNGHKFSCTWW